MSILQGGHFGKVNKAIAYPETLNLSPFMSGKVSSLQLLEFATHSLVAEPHPPSFAKGIFAGVSQVVGC